MADFGLAEIGGLATAAAGVTSAVGALSSAAAQSAEARYQAQVAKNNQQIANQNAAYASQAGEQAATAQGLKNREALEALIAEEAASGTDVNSGSNVNLRATQEAMGQLDVETTRHDALLRAYGFRSQATSFGAEAGLQTAKAEAAPTAGLISASSTLLGAAGSLATKWRGFQNLPPLPGSGVGANPAGGTGGIY